VYFFLFWICMTEFFKSFYKEKNCIFLITHTKRNEGKKSIKTSSITDIFCEFSLRFFWSISLNFKVFDFEDAFYYGRFEFINFSRMRTEININNICQQNFRLGTTPANFLGYRVLFTFLTFIMLNFDRWHHSRKVIKKCVRGKAWWWMM
jgi:hypothetical protein